MASGFGKMRQSSAVILRRSVAPPEVYFVERDAKLAFFGGYWAFPGGVLDAEDANLQLPVADAPFVVAAARELFEETGILCLQESERLSAEERTRLRRQSMDGALRFTDLAMRYGGIRTERFVPICRLTTPGFAPVRYDTIFYLVDLQDGEAPAIEPGELTAGEWMTAAAAFERWNAGTIAIVPPAIILLKLFAAAADTPAFLAAGRHLTTEYARGKIQQVYFSPGVRKLTLFTETLPPADHTNAYLVGGEALYLVDPGATRADEHARLFEALDEALATGARLEAVLLTHHHPDHASAAPVVAARYRVPVWAHAETAAELAGKIAIARLLADGDRLPLGTSPDGRGDWMLEVLHTPGHARGHLTFRESRYGAILAGDMISTASTVVIEPPGGHMTTYLTSLARLRALPKATLYPAHGPAQRDSHAVLDRYLSHRAMRERKIVAALAGEPRSLDEILSRAYDDVGPEVAALARLSLRAGLIKLCEDRVAVEVGERFRLR